MIRKICGPERIWMPWFLTILAIVAAGSFLLADVPEVDSQSDLGQIRCATG